TSWPSARRRSTKFDPMNPAPPVTSVLTSISNPIGSDFEDFRRLLVSRVVDLSFEPLGQGLDFFLARLQIILGEDLLRLLLVGLLVGVAPDVANGDAGLFGQVLDAADE